MPLLLTHIILSQDSSEIYTEIVKGSVETVVGASLGRPMCSVTKKSDIKSPIVTCYPSKSTRLYMKSTRYGTLHVPHKVVEQEANGSVKFGDSEETVFVQSGYLNQWKNTGSGDGVLFSSPVEKSLKMTCECKNCCFC